MPRHPRVRTRTILEKSHQLDLLGNNPQSLHQFLLDTLQVSDQLLAKEFPSIKEEMRIRIMGIFRSETKVDIKQLLRNQEIAHLRSESNEPHIKRFQEMVQDRQSMFMHEYGLLAINIALVDRSRVAIKEILNSESKLTDAQKAEDISNVFNSSAELTRTLTLHYCQAKKLPYKRREMQIMDLNDFGTLTQWIQEFIHYFLIESEELFSSIYDGEEKFQEDFEKRVPKIIRTLLEIYKRAKAVFEQWRQRFKSPELPANTSKNLDRVSWQIANDRIDHLHMALVGLLDELCTKPELPLAENVTQLAEWYKNMKGKEKSLQAK